MIGAFLPAAQTLPPVLIRADAAAQMGTGHVMRCLALAQAWQEAGGTVLVVCALLTPGLEARLQAEGIAVAHLDAEPGSAQDAAETLALAERVGAGWVIVDGYAFSGEYQRAIARAGLPLLAIDDFGHAGHYWAGLVLNQNLDAREELYPSREPATRLLLGTGHALLRREFWPWHGRSRTVPETARRVLVTMGGADPGNATLRVIEALHQVGLPGLEAKVVVGGSNPHVETIRQVTRTASGPGQVGGAWQSESPVELIENASNMPDLMAWADVAVSSAGTTCWELAFMRLPALLLVLADNQRPNAQELARLGAAVSLGWHADLAPEPMAVALRALLGDAEARRSMAQAGGGLVDGRGADRVTRLLAQGAVRARPVARSDCELLFGWANDSLTRRMSFRPRPIAWEEHTRWFERVLGDPEMRLLVGEAWEAAAWVPCGQVRVDADGTVSLAVAPRFRGRGLAAPLLRTAVLEARAQGRGRQLTAYIKPENAASQRVFAQAGFQVVGDAEVLGQACVCCRYGA